MRDVNHAGVKPSPSMDDPASTGGGALTRPGVLLALFCTVNFIVYCDRGMLICIPG
jgi:hypothetical protein